MHRLLCFSLGLLILSVCVCGSGMAQEPPPASPSSPPPPAPGQNYRIIIAEPLAAPTSGEYLEALHKRLEELVAHDEATSKILRQVVEVMAAGKPQPAAAATVAGAPDAATAPVGVTAAQAGLLQTLQENINYVWILLGGILVFNMQTGFAMLELGVSRAKNSINVLMKNYLDFCIASIVYLFIGFSLHFGQSWKGVIGIDGMWLPSLAADHKIWVFWFFQVGFATVACTIVSGAMAERTKYVGYLAYAALFMIFIYPMTGHWAWGSAGGSWGIGGEKGWLEALGFVDFAGSSVVHACGGACALAGIMVVGPRVGRFAKDGAPRILAGHNIPLAALGAMLLWFGWFGFNAGSTLAANSSIGRIAVNTLISPCAGAIFAMVSMWFIQGKSDVGIAINGSLGGAVGITACCASVTPASAFVIGLFSGLFTTGATVLLERFKLDDVAGAVPVHLVNGWWGTIAVALFDEKGFDAYRLSVQSMGTFSISLAAFTVCFVIFKVLDWTIGLRAAESDQIDGLDFSEHAVNAYPDFQTSEQV